MLVMTNQIIIILCFALFTSCFQSVNESSAETPLMQRYELVENVLTSKVGVVKKGEGLYQVLNRIGIDNAMALSIINALNDEVEFRTLKVGDIVTAVNDSRGKIQEFHFSQNLVDTHQLKKHKGLWRYFFKQKRTQWLSRIVEGRLIENSTLQDDLLSIGLSPSVSNDIVSILLCKVNFRMNARKGDFYRIFLKERKFEDKIIDTQVLYTKYAGSRAGDHETFLFEDDEKKSAYTAHYTSNGEALIRSGLRFPLSSMHVRSNFGWRRHPVTGKKAFHRGIDLRGRAGRKVFAVASGRVISSSFNKFAGNKISIRHRDQSISHYYHLKNRIVPKGRLVKAGELIGRVGSTGRVTGAHLHFGFQNAKKRWINPLNKRMIATPKLSGIRLEKLLLQIKGVRSLIAEAEALGRKGTYVAMDGKKKSLDLDISKVR
jgi:murein DD-endopeptidase MepM/ murein hydrolase activator NlpD